MKTETINGSIHITYIMHILRLM